MMRCKKCNQTTARMTTKREMRKLSDTLGPLTAAAATVATAAAAKGAAGAAGFALRAAKTAAKGPQALLLGVAVAAVTTAVGAGIKYVVSRREADDKTYVYCSSCGHYEAMN